MGKEAVGALMRQPLPHPYRWRLADGTLFGCRPAASVTEPKHLPRSETFEKALAAIEATWTEHRQLQRDAALTEDDIHAMLWPGEGRHARRVAAKASRRRPRHLPRYASTDSFRQMCVSLRRWWRCDGVPRLDVLKTYLARNRQIWRLHDEGDSNRQIARDLDMTEGDVRHHLRRGRSCLSELAEGIYWLADRVRNARNTLTQESSWADWFKAGTTWYAVNKRGNHQENHQKAISGLQEVEQYQ